MANNTQNHSYFYVFRIVFARTSYAATVVKNAIVVAQTSHLTHFQVL
jgi:hypothetical protein